MLKSDFINDFRIIKAKEDQVKILENGSFGHTVDCYSYKGVEARFQDADNIDSFLVNLCNFCIESSKKSDEQHTLCMVKHPTKNQFVYSTVPSHIFKSKELINPNPMGQAFRESLINQAIKDSK